MNAFNLRSVRNVSMVPDGFVCLGIYKKKIKLQQSRRSQIPCIENTFNLPKTILDGNFSVNK